MKTACRILPLSLCLALLGGASAPAQREARGAKARAAQAESGAARVSEGGPHELTPADLSAFLDGIVPLEIERGDIAGAVVTIVKDGEIFFARGYGFSDFEKKRPVSPEETLFRVGSVSKLFTWTSVLQLEEQGRVDLDGDVNRYIDFRIPATFGRPVTLRNLMTHTPGFEEAEKDLFGSGTPFMSLHDYVATHLPRRIYPPGTVPAYSNYGATLAGYIVQRISGRPFDDYVAENIFKPLGMTHSSFDQPLPEPLQGMMSEGYIRASGGPKPFEIVIAAPAGSLATSGVDMAHFMIAHLADGEYRGVRILRPETARLMHTRQFSMDPSINGICLGFYEEDRNGHRIIGHAGDTQLFHTDLHLMPDQHLGFFVSYNSLGRDDPNAGSERTALWDKFLDRYYPYMPPPAATLASARDDAHLVSGSYLSSRRSQTNLFFLLALLSESTVSSPKNDGIITLDEAKDLNGEPMRWREIAPLRYRNVNGQEEILFKRAADGHLDLLGIFPVFISQSVSGTANKKLLLPLMVVSLGIIVLAILLWPIGALLRKHYKQPLRWGPGDRRLRLAVKIVCILDLLFVVGLAVLVSKVSNDIGALNSRLDPLIHLTQVVGLLGALGSFVVIYYAYRAWRGGQPTILLKLGDTVLALACVGFAWVLLISHMLNFNLHY
ncbi:MAG TPA: serine hydrolase domain-containing protein [Candidatus Cybelea sp.]|nr:serine hydrolase domain-containing protein [Candidatus Cybelea sp.]